MRPSMRVLRFSVYFYRLSGVTQRPLSLHGRWGRSLSGGLRGVFTSDVDFDPSPWAPLPSLGDAGFFTKKSSPRITGLRTKPPILEVRQYNEKAPINFCDSATLSLWLSIIRLFGVDSPTGEQKPPIMRDDRFRKFHTLAEGQHSSCSRPKNATTYAHIRQAHTTEEKLRAQEELRTRRITSEKQQMYEEANRQKYLRTSNETRHGRRSAERSVSPSHAMPNFHTPAGPLPISAPPASAFTTSERVWGPLMDMSEYQRAHALWLRHQKEQRAQMLEGRTSSLSLCGRTSETSRK